ncbi:MAG: hypothetical protein FJY80_10880 [Candidatus Aminicenantes bacterium]|nr:hypothetical protein [Candidatus Aminicenantes bacterium]MBM3312000.1 hypothetical protein [Candidatus Aminicenantes bacterium]
MKIKTPVSSRLLACFLAASVAVMTIPVAHFAQAAAPADGALMGYVYDVDERTPVRNVVVKLRNVVTQHEYSSEPTTPLGMYSITAIEEGRYLMGVQTPNGAYNFQYSLYLKGSETARLSVALNPKGFSPLQQTGGAAGDDKPKGFFKSPMGLLTLIVVAEAVLFAIVLIEKEASPIR